MAEGFESYHVPQQSRRDKLRVNNHHHPPPPQPPGCVDHLQPCASLLPHYDPSLIPSDFVNCAANVHRQAYPIAGNTSAVDNSGGVKEEGMGSMGFLGDTNGNHVFADPHLSSVQLNPSTIQYINGSGPYAYASPAHCYRGIIDQSYHHQEPSNNNNNSASARGQGLSLSLSSHHNNLPVELNLQNYDFNNNKLGGGYVVPCKGAFNSIEFSKSAVPLGPFTGYASILKGSRFLRPAQQLLEELCDMGRVMYNMDRNGDDHELLDPPPFDHLSIDDFSDVGVQSRKKSRLISMLDEVYKRYKQYYHQMQAAVAAFESVAGLSSAAPFASLALKAMSKHFRCLKNAITDQLQFASRSLGKVTNCDRDETHQRLENSGKGTSYGQRSFHSTTGSVDPPVWRPQRGLPEHAVTVLRSWLFEHFLHPYPSDTDKLMLAKQTGLSRNQVSNWFINARVRLWKPMVEEIHMLETGQSQKPSQRDEQSPNAVSDRLHTTRLIECENQSTSKRSREDPIEIPRVPIKFPYNNPQSHAGVRNAGGVSLTLGLHQNGLGLSDNYPIHAARRLGLDSHGDEYAVSGFAAQNNRRFGREIMEGQQIMHDFVG